MCYLTSFHISSVRCSLEIRGFSTLPPPPTVPVELKLGEHTERGRNIHHYVYVLKKNHTQRRDFLEHYAHKMKASQLFLQYFLFSNCKCMCTFSSYLKMYTCMVIDTTSELIQTILGVKVWNIFLPIQPYSWFHIKGTWSFNTNLGWQKESERNSSINASSQIQHCMMYRIL